VTFRVPIRRAANDIRSIIGASPSGPGLFLEDPLIGGGELEAQYWGLRHITVTMDAELAGIHSLADLERVWSELASDGLRDLLTLYRLADQEGRGENLIWTAREHIKGTLYEPRAKRLGYGPVEAAITARLQLLATLGVEWPDVKTLPSVNSVLTLVTGVRTGKHLLTLHPALSLQRGGAVQRYARMPEVILVLPTAAMLLGVDIVAHFHHQAPKMDSARPCVRLRAGTLWTWARLRAGALTESRRWPDTHQVLERHLSVLQSHHVIGAFKHVGPMSPEARYVIEPPPWWCAVVLHKTAKPNTVSLAGTPRQGGGLRDWRKARGLTQRGTAVLLSTGQSTVSRVERGNELLPRAWRRVMKLMLIDG
jgi:hypothetical protein